MITSIHPNPNTIGQLDPGLDIPVNDWWGIRFNEGDRMAWQGAISRGVDRVFRAGAEIGAKPYGIFGEAALDELFGPGRKTMTAEEATKAYGVEGALKFDAPIREEDAIERRQRTLTEAAHRQWWDAAQHGLGWKSISGFGAMVAGQMSNPLDFGLSIIPVFGAEKVGAQAAARAGWRQAWKFGQPLTAMGERGGFIGFKAPGVLSKIPLFTESVLNGAASSAIGEIPVYIDQRLMQEETNYFGNVLVGAAASGGFHFSIRLLGKMLAPAARALRSLTPETLEVAGAKALDMDTITPEDGPLQRAAAGADENVIGRSTEQTRPIPEDSMRLIEEFMDGRKTPEFDRLAAEQDVKVEGRSVEDVVDELFRKLEGQREVIEVRSAANTGDEIQIEGKNYRVYAVQETTRDGKTERVVTAREIETPEQRAVKEAQREARVKAFVESQDPKVVEKKEAAKAQRGLSDAEKRTAPTPKGDKWSKALGDLEKEKAQADADSAALEIQLRKELAEELGDTEQVNQLDLDLKKLKDEIEATAKAEKAAIDCLMKGFTDA